MGARQAIRHLQALRLAAMLWGSLAGADALAQAEQSQGASDLAKAAQTRSPT